jgi:MoxR-like ATPase
VEKAIVFSNYSSVVVGTKKVFLSQPYRAATTALVARESELQLIAASWLASKHGPPLSPLLVGPPGVGKNHIVYEIARLADKDLFIFQGHDDVTSEDLACSVRFSDDAARQMDYILSPLMTAMHVGGICFVDEIAKIRPRALSNLASVLDDRRYIDAAMLGERVYAHPDFRFISATNNTDLDGQILPEFILSRLRPVIHIGYPSRESMDHLISTHAPSLQPSDTHLLDCFWSLWHAQEATNPPSPRDAVQTFSLAQKLADYEAIPKSREKALQGRNGGSTKLRAETSRPITREHVTRAFGQLFQAQRT